MDFSIPLFFQLQSVSLAAGDAGVASPVTAIPAANGEPPQHKDKPASDVREDSGTNKYDVFFGLCNMICPPWIDQKSSQIWPTPTGIPVSIPVGQEFKCWNFEGPLVSKCRFNVRIYIFVLSL